MTDKPLDSYIKSPPPADERSHFQYIEDQLSKLENVSKKHVTRIEDNNEAAKALITEEYNARVDGDEAQAQYTLTVAAETLGSASALVSAETTARTTATNALASQISTLNTNVGTLSGAITSEASLRISQDEALGTRIDNLVLTNGSDAAVIIDEEATARIAADYAEATKRLNLSAYIGYTDGQSYSKTLAASVADETTARVADDKSLAQKVTYLSAGTSRVIVQTSAPTSTGRLKGDVWYDSDDSFKPYVWAQVNDTGSYDWRDNTDGTYTKYVGQFANIEQKFVVLYDPTNNTSLAYQINQVSAVANKQKVYRQATAPNPAVVTLVAGDLWLDSDDNNKAYYWNSSSWIDTSDTRLTTITKVYRQTSQPTGSVVGDLWFDTDDGNKPYYWTGTSWVVIDDTSKATVANVTSQVQTLSNNDKAVARYAFGASVGTGRVYTINPGTESRIKGDVWFDADNGFTPYVWAQVNDAGDFNWRDNSGGEYTKYIGQMAAVTQTATAAQDKANGLSYEWRLQGTIDGQPSGSIRLTGAKKNNTDGSTSTVSTVIIDANAVINGSLIVADSIGSSQIAAGAVTSTEIANSSVNSDKISNGAVTEGKIGAGAITSVKIADGSVTAIKMPDNVITGTKIADGAITTQKIAANAITANLINAQTITADKIVAKSITTDVVADNAISRSGFVTGAISSATPSQSTQVTVRSGARIQFIAILEGTDSVTVTSTPWANYTNPFYGTTAVAESAQPDFGTIGYLNAVRSISGTSDVVKSYKILGYKSSSSERYIYGPDGSNRWQKVRDWVYSPIAVTGILYYQNTSSSEQTVTFTITTTSGSNSGSVVASTVTGSATELAK
jgi:hypothetical protein